MEMTVKLMYYLLFVVLATGMLSTGASDDVRAEVGGSVSLPCRVDTAQCGELHSVKWYRDNQRVYVFSHVANIRRPEGDGSERMEVEYTPNSSVSRLHIKEVALTDEALYKCEKTYLEVRENCDVVQVIKLRTLVRPQSVRILGRDGSALGNATTLPAANEGSDLELECEAAGAKPVPQVTWYNGSTIINGVYSSEEGSHGVGTARSKLRLTLQRGDLFAEFRCVVESDALDYPIVSWLRADVSVQPTGLNLTGVKSHVVQGSNVLLTCKVFGARPAANVTWYNGSEPINPDMINTNPVITELTTKTVKMADSTYDTVSELIFAASRYENGQTLTCEAENAVLREQNEKPLHEKLKLEVLYPPIVSINSGNITVNESDEVLIICSYVANPAQLDYVKWQRNGQVINVNDDHFHYEGGTIRKPSLAIKNVTREDAGEYYCTLKNSVGSQESPLPANVNVYFKPQVQLRMEPTNIVKVADRVNVTLLCDVSTGNPDTLLRVQWYLGGDLLKELPDENCTNDVNSDRTFCDLDPSRLLLEYVAQNFAGNYSCRGMNDAGWGPVSEDTELIVYYPPSQAIVRYEPAQVVKHGAFNLSCSVEDTGRPEDTRYLWRRGNHEVPNVTTPKWVYPPVDFETNSSFTCIAYNEGGEGPPGTVQIEVFAPPAFIVPLQPYTGALMNAEDIKLTCRVECLPTCRITWLKDGHEIVMPNPRYYVNNTKHPSDKDRYDFESVQSVLHFNMSAWPNGQLDRINDNANYTCRSTENKVGPSVWSTTLFGVEYQPENITVSSRVISVPEHQNPPRVTCTAKGAPEVSYMWFRSTNMQEPVTKGNKLSLTGVTRSSAGHYVCMAINRHGNITEKIYLSVHFKPECGITQTEFNGQPALVCTANAIPREVKFTWRVKGMNETPEDMRSVEQHGLKSYLFLDPGVDTFRTYVCYANNTVDMSKPCERDVAGTIAWWKRLDNENLLIIIAIIVGIIVCVIIVCIIIVIVCRRKRANNKYNNPVELEEREKPDGQSPDSTSQSKWPLKPGVLVHVNRMHNLNMRNLSQLSLNTSTEVKHTRMLPKAGRRLRNFGRSKNHRSRLFRLKEILGFGHPDALPIGVYQGANGVVTFKKINASTPNKVEPTTQSRKRKKPGSAPNPSNTADKNGNPTGNASDPHADPENKTFYENLPFHGMQNPPNKPVSIITPFMQDSTLQKSTPNLNISTKSLVHAPNNPVSSPVTQHTNKIQRNQSFHGFQLSSRGDTNQINTISYPLNQSMPLQNPNFYPTYRSNLSMFQNPGMTWNNQIYGNNQFCGNRAIGPLILAPNPSRFPQNRIPSMGNLSANRNFNFNPFNSQLRSPFTMQMPEIRPQQNNALPSLTDRKIQSLKADEAVVNNSGNAASKIHEKDNAPVKTSESNVEQATSKQSVISKKHTTRCGKKFGSFEHRKHKCNSPMFYSVRCRKHGKKRTIFELYTLPVKHKSGKNTTGKTKTSEAEIADEKSSVNDIKTNCVVVSEIPKYPKENDAKNPETDEALYQNLTDSIQILEQNSENNIYEVIQARPRPAPRCKKSPSNIYQNIAFVLKVTPEKNQNECNTLKEDQDKMDNDKSPDCKVSEQTSCEKPNTSSDKNKCQIDNSSAPNQTKPKPPVPLQKPLRKKPNIPNTKTKGDTPEKTCETVTDKPIDKPTTESIPNENNVPAQPKTDVSHSSDIKRPIPIKPKDFSNPALIPKMPILDTHSKWSAVPLARNKNPFYTLTTPQLTPSHQQFSAEQLYSTFPHQRHAAKLVPRALFPEQQIAKSKSFSSRSKQKKHFQIPLQKCHSFKFQTAESYFQPIKNIHEENLMRNGYQSDYGPNYPRTERQSRDNSQGKRDRHIGNSAVFRRSSDTQKYRENLQFHENIQNSVQLQYPQPLYAHNSASGKKNGVVYADLDMNSKSDKKRSSDDLRRSQNSKTEYATLKFNDIGQEIDV